MASHLTLPYNWTDCTDPEKCQEHTHLPDTAENLNTYPLTWITELLGTCQITTHSLIFLNSDGLLHRDNGPAEEYSSGNRSWCQNGELHRTDGPAKESFNNKYWHRNGKLHRENGPAVEKADGTQEWWVNGTQHPNPPYA